MRAVRSDGAGSTTGVGLVAAAAAGLGSRAPNTLFGRSCGTSNKSVATRPNRDESA